MSNNYNTNFEFKIPNEFIQTKERNKKLALTYIHICRRGLYEGGASTSLYHLLKQNDYAVYKRNQSVVQQFKEQLQFLVDIEMISTEKEISKYSINDHIEIQILDKFNPSGYFTKISVKDIVSILDSDCNIDKSNLMAVYLYVKSKIRYRNVNDLKQEFNDCKKKPKSFWSTYEAIEADIGISNVTIGKCLKVIVSLGLLKKKTVGSCIKQGKTKPENVPNIYVLNDENWQQEIDWTLDLIKEHYHTQKFLPLKAKRTLDNNNNTNKEAV